MGVLTEEIVDIIRFALKDDTTTRCPTGSAEKVDNDGIPDEDIRELTMMSSSRVAGTECNATIEWVK